MLYVLFLFFYYFFIVLIESWMVYNRIYILYKILKYNVMLKCNLIVNCIILYVVNKVKNVG